ncbi:MAG: ATPase domain-containing protein [Candidatus Micrarchaeia archaeon]
MEDQVERIKTDIEGLDNLLFGGIPVSNQVLIAGGPGTGKTLMSFEILYHCAKSGIPSAFIALEEQPSTVVRNAKITFAKFPDIDELISRKALIVDGEDPALRVTTPSDSQMYSFGNMLSDIEAIVKENGAKVIAIDSISIIKLMIGDPFVYRKSMIALVSNLRRLGITSIITSDISSTERTNLKFTQEFFIFDGIIALYANGQEDRRIPTMEVLKMRGSNHSWMLSPYEITEDGFRIFAGE